MSLQRYPECKDSEVAWLGKVPSHWQAHRLKNLFEIRKRIVGEEGHQVLSITQRGIKVKDIESNDGQLSMDYTKYQIVHPGDFAMNHMDLLTGFVDISPYAGVTSPDYRVFALRDGVLCEPRYFLYLFQNAYRQKIFYAFGQGASEFGRWRFPTDQFNDFRFPFPPPGEQTLIATFLDRETGKIDALIAEQEKLIALLAEKRQATISHAVTKGLNPDAPMKDSGVEGLGEVPAHWNIISLARLASEKCDGPFGSGIKSEHYKDDGALVVRLQNIRAEGFFDGEPAYLDLEYFQNELLRHAVLPGDILIAGLGDDRNLVGRACVAPDNLGPALVKADCFRFRLIASLALADFIATQLSATAICDSGRLATGSTRSRIPLSIMASRKMAIPQMKEQADIVNFIKKENAKLDALTAEATRGIALLKERRSALISAAVTGKIDVRHLAEAEAA